MVAHDGKYIHIEIPEAGFAKYTWQTATEDMTEEEYHEQNDIILETVNEHNIRKHLLDTRKFNFAITPEIQEVVVQRFFAPLTLLGDQKAAFLVPEDIFAQVSLEQVMEEEASGTLKTRYFEDEDAAKTWLEA